MSQADFGLQGRLPVDPEMLHAVYNFLSYDFLALPFVTDYIRDFVLVLNAPTGVSGQAPLFETANSSV